MANQVTRRVLIVSAGTPLRMPDLPATWEARQVDADRASLEAAEVVVLGADIDGLQPLVERLARRPSSGPILVAGPLPPERIEALCAAGVTDFAADGDLRFATALRRIVATLSLPAASGRLGDLAREIGNDLGNAMTAVLGYTQLIADDADANKAEDALELRNASERAGRLTAQLLNLVKTWTPGAETELRELMLQHQHAISRLYDEVRLDFHLGEDPATVALDAGHVLQAVVDLIDAVCAASSRAASISVALQARGGATRIRVCVSSISRETDTLGEQLAWAQRCGTGALSISCALARAAGGEIRYERRGRHITLELSLPELAAGARAPTPEPTGHGHLLLAEDDGMIRKLTARALRDAGFTVLEASSAESGLVLAAESPLAVVVADVRLEGALSGIELINALRQSAPALPAVLTTGAGTLPIGHSLPSGTPIVFKPYTRAEIREAVQSVCAREAGA